MNPIRIILVDDHALVRAGIRTLLQQISGIEVMAEADDAAEALRLIGELKPDIVLMDISMSGLNGLDATAQLTKEYPEVKVIILSMHVEQEYVLQALRAGAKGYLLKGARTAELELAVNAVASGETYLSPAASKHAVGDIVQRHTGERSLYEHLTPRQQQVLQLVAEGNTRKQIAQKLNLSVKTVDTYRAQLVEQLNIRDVAGLVRFALRIGLIHETGRRPEDKAR
jgi:DNA-binding NarL/FixJ family response regulator